MTKTLQSLEPRKHVPPTMRDNVDNLAEAIDATGRHDDEDDGAICDGNHRFMQPVRAEDLPGGAASECKQGNDMSEVSTDERDDLRDVEGHDATTESMDEDRVDEGHRYNTRHKRSKHPIVNGKHYGYHLTVKKGLERFGDKALESMISEISQLLDKDVIDPKHAKSLSKEQWRKIIRSSMFLKEKYLSTGAFDKLKARLVAGGHMQDRTIYDDLSSPTVSISSLFMLAAIAANERREVVTADIGGAYLNADMGDIEVLMKLDPLLDPQITVALYVDDLLITSRDSTLIDATLTELRARYKQINIHRGKVHSYLGMTFNFEDPVAAKITMEGYVDDYLKAYDVTGTAVTPAINDLFKVSGSPELSADEREKFHSQVAKLLYLAKRTRPNILTAIAFLSSRVSCATEADKRKLERVNKY